MRVVVGTSVIGILVWFLLMLALGPIGIYIGFFVQMFLRSVGIFFYSRQFWPLRFGWTGLVVGSALVLLPLFVANLY